MKQWVEMLAFASVDLHALASLWLRSTSCAMDEQQFTFAWMLLQSNGGCTALIKRMRRRRRRKPMSMQMAVVVVVVVVKTAVVMTTSLPTPTPSEPSQPSDHRNFDFML